MRTLRDAVRRRHNPPQRLVNGCSCRCGSDHAMAQASSARSMRPGGPIPSCSSFCFDLPAPAMPGRSHLLLNSQHPRRLSSQSVPDCGQATALSEYAQYYKLARADRSQVTCPAWCRPVWPACMEHSRGTKNRSSAGVTAACTPTIKGWFLASIYYDFIRERVGACFHAARMCTLACDAVSAVSVRCATPGAAPCRCRIGRREPALIVTGNVLAPTALNSVKFQPLFLWHAHC